MFLPPSAAQSKIIQDTRQALRLPNWIAACLLSIAFLIGAGLVGVIPALLFFIIQGTLRPPATALGSAFYQAALNIFSFGPIFLLIWLWVRLYEKRPFRTLGLDWAGAGVKYLRGFLLGALMFALTTALLALLGNLRPGSAAPASIGFAALPAVLIMLMGWFVQGPGEELLCRGWLMPVIGVRYNVALGVLLSSTLFGLYHTLNPSFSILALVNIFLVGVFLCLYTLKDGAIWGVFGWHSAWNWVQGNVFGLSVSGLELNGGSIFSFRTEGAAILTGGGFGPEGGLAVTLVLLIGIAAAWLLIRRKSPQNLPENPV